MKNYLFLTSLFVSTLLFAQKEMGIQLGYGISSITFDVPNLDPNITSIEQIKTSILIGGYYEKEFKKFGGIGASVYISQFKGLKMLKSIEDTNEVQSDFYYRYTSFALPIYYLYKYEKINFQLGIRPSIIIGSGIDYKRNEFRDGALYDSYTSKFPKLAMDLAILGVQSGIGYNFSDRWQINVLFYRDLQNISNPNDADKGTSWQSILSLKYKIK